MAAVPADGPGPASTVPGASKALALLLAVNLFNYIDRQILSAVLPKLKLDADLFSPTDPLLDFKLGLLTSAFLVSYTLLSPVFGWFGDRGRRWVVVGVGVTVWSLASGGSGLATSFAVLLVTRCFVGIGEAAYGPVAPAMISDLFPVSQRGKKIALFYVAIPVGSALGFVLGGLIGEAFGWRAAFLATLVGLVPAALAFFMPEPPRQRTAGAAPGYFTVVRELVKIKSFVLCCLGMTATTFMLGGVAAWAPIYIYEREARFELTESKRAAVAAMTTTAGTPVVPPAVVEKLAPLIGQPLVPFGAFRAQLLAEIGEADVRQYGEHLYVAAEDPNAATLSKVNFRFGLIIVVSGLSATLLGGWLGDKLRTRGVRGAYFLAAGWPTVLAWPFFVGALFAPFPLAWGMLFVAVFGMFFNTGPANTVLANVVRSPVRATAFAVNILVIHMLGDVVSPPFIGAVAYAADLHTAFLVVSFSIPIGGGLWILGARHLDADTARAAG